MTYTLERIIAVLKAKNYSVFEQDTKNYNLNLVGIRAPNSVPNAFDDVMTVFWKYNGKWTLRYFPCTTDPGLYWLKEPTNPFGTGIVKEGQYKSLWQLGLHQGKYTGLTQKNEVTCIRDFDKDNVLDFTQPDLTFLTKKQLNDKYKTVEWYDKEGKLVWREQTGFFGMNGHRANSNGGSIQVDRWSAMCQVLQNKSIFNPENQAVKVYEYDYFINLCQKAKAAFGNSFTYSLINDKDFYKPAVTPQSHGVPASA